MSEGFTVSGTPTGADSYKPCNDRVGAGPNQLKVEASRNLNQNPL